MPRNIRYAARVNRFQADVEKALLRPKRFKMNLSDAESVQHFVTLRLKKHGLTGHSASRFWELWALDQAIAARRKAERKAA